MPDFNHPKVIIAVQQPDGTVVAIGGIAEEVDITMIRDAVDEYDFGTRRAFAPPKYHAEIYFAGAVSYQHVPGFDDVPDPEPSEIPNRKELEG